MQVRGDDPIPALTLPSTTGFQKHPYTGRLVGEDGISEEKRKMMKASDDPCWKGYRMLGMKEKDGKQVPNCIPKKKNK